MPLSEEEIAQYKEIFDQYDTDGSGSISPEEFKDALAQFGYKLSDEEVQALVSEIDKDGSGSVSFEELIAVIGRRPRRKRIMARLRRLFKRLDTDGSGFITAEDLRKVIDEAGAGEEVSDEQITELIAAADKSGDGQISYEEFVLAIAELYAETEQA